MTVIHKKSVDGDLTVKLIVKAKITSSKILKLKDAYQGDERLFCLGWRFSGKLSEA